MMTHRAHIKEAADPKTTQNDVDDAIESIIIVYFQPATTATGQS